MVNRDTRRALAHAGSRPSRPARVVVRRNVMPDDETDPAESVTTTTKVGDRARPVKTTAAPSSRPPKMSATIRPVRRRPSTARVKGRSPAFWVSLAVMAVALVAIVVQGSSWYEQSQLESAKQEALAAARQSTINFVTISAATVDQDLQRVAAGATGDFKDEFTKAMAQVRAAVIENKVDSQGTILRAAVVSADRGNAIVLVAVDATVRNVNAPAGHLTHYRIRVNLALVGRAWLVSKLEFVG